MRSDLLKNAVTHESIKEEDYICLKLWIYKILNRHQRKHRKCLTYILR